MKPAVIHTSRDAEIETGLFTRKGDELPLSGQALVELLRAVLDKGVPFRFRAKGHSMSPFIKDGDMITISPVKNGPVGFGGVVSYINLKRKRLFVHRVVRRVGGDYLIKADSSIDSSTWVPKENILGSVTMVERNGKQVRLGLGPERFLIAFLSRAGLLSPFLSPLWKLARPFLKRMSL